MRKDEPVFPEEMRALFKKHYIERREEYLQKALLELRKAGYSQMQSLFLLIDELGISFVEANRIVLNSEAWK